MVTPKNIIIQDLELADKEIKRLREENRKLKEEVDKERLFKEAFKDYANNNQKLIAIQHNRIKELEEKIRFLEQCLDNKEKVNISMREELEKLKVKYWDLDY